MKSNLVHLLFIAISCLLTQSASAQDTDYTTKTMEAQKRKFAVKVGANYSYQSVVKSFSVSSNFGFFAGGYFAPPTTSRFGFRSELLLSRQGYDYASSRQTGNVMLTYVLLPQLTTFRINRFLELQAGAQVAFLLNASVDSSANPSSVPNFEKASSGFNRLNYGIAAGFEVSPSKGSFIGTRYNLFFEMYKQNSSGGYPAYVPDYSGNLKNGLVQLYVGFRF